jgi:hypothetical protein
VSRYNRHNPRAIAAGTVIGTAISAVIAMLVLSGCSSASASPPAAAPSAAAAPSTAACETAITAEMLTHDNSKPAACNGLSDAQLQQLVAGMFTVGATELGAYCVPSTEYNNLVVGWNALTEAQRTAYAKGSSGDAIATYANAAHPGWSNGLTKAQTADITKPACA